MTHRILLGAVVVVVMSVHLYAQEAAQVDWGRTEWFGNPPAEKSLRIRNVVPILSRSLVQLTVPIIVNGQNVVVTVPAPLNFVSQEVIYHRVAATRSGTKLAAGRDFRSALLVSDQGQPFFCLELNGVDGDVRITMQSLLLLPDDTDEKAWQRKVEMMRFGAPPDSARLLVGQTYVEPPVMWKKPLDEWMERAYRPNDRSAIQAIVESTAYVNKSLTYDLKVADPFVALLKERRGHCGVFSDGLRHIGQRLNQDFGMEVFRAGGYWGNSPHVRNGVILYADSRTPVFLFADANMGKLQPQGLLAFVVTSTSEANTFGGLRTPRENLVPDVPFGVNLMNTRGGRIVSWEKPECIRVKLEAVSVPAATRQKLQSEVRTRTKS